MQRVYNQDVIKSYSSYICHTPARKNSQTNSIPPFLQNSPFLGSPLPFSNFSIPSFLGFLVRSIPPFKMQGELELCTKIPDCDYHSPALLDLFISPDALFPLGNSNCVVVSASIEITLYLQWDVQFNCIAYDYSCTDWDGLSDHLRDVPWEDIFRLGASAASKEFCEWAHIGIDVYDPH